MEKGIYDALDQVGLIEKQSVRIKDAYKENIQTLGYINKDQDEILRYLDEIEKELDQIMDSTGGVYKPEEILDSQEINSLSSRQQIFLKARRIESVTDDITRDLVEVEK